MSHFPIKKGYYVSFLGMLVWFILVFCGMNYQFCYIVTVFIKMLGTRGIQKVCGPTMKETRYKGHSMDENTTSQLKNIHQEKSFQIHLLFLHTPSLK